MRSSRRKRILCVDSSEERRVNLQVALDRAGFDVCIVRDIDDALSLTPSLPLDAVVADQPSTLDHEENWEKLMALNAAPPVLVHSAAPSVGDWSASASEFAAVRTGNPEIIMAILTLLLGPAGWHDPEGSAYHTA